MIPNCGKSESSETVELIIIERTKEVWKSSIDIVSTVKCVEASTYSLKRGTCKQGKLAWLPLLGFQPTKSDGEGVGNVERCGVLDSLLGTILSSSTCAEGR